MCFASRPANDCPHILRLNYYSSLSIFTATVVVELLGSPEAISIVKHLIVLPGLLILIPALAATGATGFALSKHRRSRLVATKKKRMPIIAAKGILILIPSAIVLDQWASFGVFDLKFYVVQFIELATGAINLTLMGMNTRDGLRLAGKMNTKRYVAVEVHD